MPRAYPRRRDPDTVATGPGPRYPPSVRPAAFEPVVSRFAAGLVDQHRQLVTALRREGPDLEWQPAPGRNSIGMLLAHVAVAEVWWLDVSARGVPEGAEAVARVHARLGIGPDDDGMPLEPGGSHAPALSDWSLERYVELLGRAQACTVECLASWRDDELDDPVRVGARSVTKGWILYHVLEHLAQHVGQVGLLIALQRPV